MGPHFNTNILKGPQTGAIIWNPFWAHGLAVSLELEFQAPIFGEGEYIHSASLARALRRRQRVARAQSSEPNLPASSPAAQPLPLVFVLRTHFQQWRLVREGITLVRPLEHDAAHRRKALRFVCHVHPLVKLELL